MNQITENNEEYKEINEDFKKLEIVKQFLPKDILLDELNIFSLVVGSERRRKLSEIKKRSTKINEAERREK